MGGRLASLGVDVVHVVVEGDLVPGFGHLHQVVAGQLAPHDARLARSGGAEIVGQGQLARLVTLGAHQFLHDLQQHPGRVLGHGPFGRVEDLVVQGLEGHQTLFHVAATQGSKQVDGRIGDAQPLGFGQFLDAQGVKMGIIDLAQVSRRGATALDLVDDVEQFAVPPIEHEAGDTVSHGQFQALVGGPAPADR